MNNTVTLDLETYNELYTKAMLYDEKKKEVEIFLEKTNRVDLKTASKAISKQARGYNNYPIGGLE